MNHFSCVPFFPLKIKWKLKIHLCDAEVLFSTEDILNLVYKKHNGECYCIWCVFVLLATFMCKIRE